MSEPLTPEREADIRYAIGKIDQLKGTTGEYFAFNFTQDEVRPLLAELDRLRLEIAGLQKAVVA